MHTTPTSTSLETLVRSSTSSQKFDRNDLVEVRKNIDTGRITTTTTAPSNVSKTNGKDTGSRNNNNNNEMAFSSEGEKSGGVVSRGGVVTPFPWKLHDMLERVHMDDFDHIVCWQPHGRSFMVHNTQEFVDQVMPIYFNQTKFASFQRQLNLYGFRRITQGRDKGAYYHESFLRGRRILCQHMKRQKIKGTKVRRSIVPSMEPDFWRLPFLPDKNKQPTKEEEEEEEDESLSSSSCRGEEDQSEISSPFTMTNFSSSGEENHHHKKNDMVATTLLLESGEYTNHNLLSEDDFILDDNDLLFFEGRPFHYIEAKHGVISDGESLRPRLTSFDLVMQLVE